jgi:hypothetical protein
MYLKGEPYYGWGGKTYLNVYEAPHPWGLWTKVNKVALESELGWYNPVILNKFTAPVNDATVKTYVACAGDFAEPQTHYKLNLIPLTLKRDFV